MAKKPYTAMFTLGNLFQNPAMSKVLPQLGSSPLRNVYSYRETEQRVRNYLAGMLRTITSDDDGLVVRGKHQTVLRQIEGMKGQIEALFNAMPKVAQHMRAGTKLYLPYVTLSQISELRGVLKKQRLLQQIVDNLTFNPDFNNFPPTGSNWTPIFFSILQEDWMKRVGYKK